MFERVMAAYRARKSSAAQAATPVADAATCQVDELEAEVARLEREGEAFSIEVRDLKTKIKDLEGERDCLAIELRIQQGQKFLTVDETVMIKRQVEHLRFAVVSNRSNMVAKVYEKELGTLEGLLSRCPCVGTVLHPGKIEVVGPPDARAWQPMIDSINKSRDEQWEAALKKAGVPLEKRS